jgi:nucleoside-diphosphate-sugar epimerase
MRYAVTGAAGFIGSHLAETLQEQGHDVESEAARVRAGEPLGGDLRDAVGRERPRRRAFGRR